MKPMFLLSMIALTFMGCDRSNKGESANIDALIQSIEEKADLHANYGVVTLDDLAFFKDEELKSYHPPLALNQRVKILSNPEQPLTLAKRTYFKVQSINNPEHVGYVSSYFVAVNGQLAVVSNPEAPISPNPDSMKLTELTVPAFAIIAIYPKTAKNGFVAFDYIKESYLTITNRYIRENDLSLDENDLKAAIYYQFALSSPSKKLKEQYMIAARDQNSMLAIPYLEAYQNIMNESNTLVTYQAKATVKKGEMASFYAQANNQSLLLSTSRRDSNVALNLISRSANKESVDGVSAYWYLDQNLGWVFGSQITIVEDKPIATNSEE